MCGVPEAKIGRSQLCFVVIHNVIIIIDKKIIQRSKARTAQVLEGVERRGKKRAHDAEQGEKEQSNKRTRRTKNSSSGANSRRSDGAEAQGDAEKGAGGRDGHTAGHRTNRFGDG